MYEAHKRKLACAFVNWLSSEGVLAEFLSQTIAAFQFDQVPAEQWAIFNDIVEGIAQVKADNSKCWPELYPGGGADMTFGWFSEHFEHLAEANALLEIQSREAFEEDVVEIVTRQREQVGDALAWAIIEDLTGYLKERGLAARLERKQLSEAQLEVKALAKREDGWYVMDTRGQVFLWNSDVFENLSNPNGENEIRIGDRLAINLSDFTAGLARAATFENVG